MKTYLAQITVLEVMMAANHDDLNDALRELQDKLGIETGDIAAQFCSDGLEELWPSIPHAARMNKLIRYIQFEDLWRIDVSKLPDVGIVCGCLSCAG